MSNVEVESRSKSAGWTLACCWTRVPACLPRDARANQAPSHRSFLPSSPSSPSPGLIIAIAMAWSTTALLLFSPLSWFRRPAKTDYEEVLADLAAEIEVTQTNLVQIRARTRRASLILPFWASFIWLVWTAGCYWLGMLGSGGGPVGSDASWLVWGPVVATPVV